MIYCSILFMEWLQIFFEKNDISPKDIKEIEIEDITEDRIREVRDKIYVEYKKQGGNSHVAKSTMFINTVNKALMIELKSEKI